MYPAFVHKASLFLATIQKQSAIYQSTPICVDVTKNSCDMLNVSWEEKGSLLQSKTRNLRGFKAYRQAAKLGS